MSCNSGEFSDFSYFVAQTYDLIGNPTGAGGYSLAQVSGYFLSQGTMGKLNNCIDANYYLSGLYSGTSLTGFLVTPDLCTPELGILQNLFMVDYYNTFANQILRSASSSVGSVLSTKDGDGGVQFVNKSQLAATIRGLAKDSREILEKSVRDYLRFAAGGGEVILSSDTFGFPIVNTVGYYGASYNWSNWRVNYIPFFGSVY